MPPGGAFEASRSAGHGTYGAQQMGCPNRKRQTTVRLALALALSGLCLTGASANEAAKPEKGGEAAKPGTPVSLGMYFDMPDLTINLNSQKPAYLKIRISLQMSNESDREKLTTIVPVLIDGFQNYLRELHESDLRGSIGMYHLRNELLLRASILSKPVEIKDVLFREVLVR